MSEWDAPMRETLAKLEMLSHGATVSYNKSGGESGEPDDKVAGQVARGVEEPPHILFRRRYDEQVGDVGRRTVWEEAEAELSAWTHTSSPEGADSISFDEQILEDGEGFEPKQVAQRFGISSARVCRIRTRNGREMGWGRRVEDVLSVVDANLAVRAREMRDRNLTQRQIALSLGVHRNQVVRWTGPNRKAA